jgi:hypothetical protein
VCETCKQNSKVAVLNPEIESKIVETVDENFGGLLL